MVTKTDLFCVHVAFHGVVHSLSPGGVVNGGLDIGELGSVTDISVSRDIFVFVSFPGMEQVADVQVVSVVSVLGQIRHKFTLEINLGVTILQIFIPEKW